MEKECLKLEQMDKLFSIKMAHKFWLMKNGLMLTWQIFSAIVSSAVGMDTTRGDNIVIKNMEFIQEDMAAMERLLKEREMRELIRNIVKYISIGVIVSLFFFFVIRPFHSMGY